MYYNEHIEEEVCADEDAAEGFLDELAVLLDEIARMQAKRTTISAIKSNFFFILFLL